VDFCFWLQRTLQITDECLARVRYLDLTGCTRSGAGAKCCA